MASRSLNFDKKPFFNGASFSVSVSMYVTIFLASDLSSGEIGWELIKDKASSGEMPILIFTVPELPKQ